MVKKIIKNDPLADFILAHVLNLLHFASLSHFSIQELYEISKPEGKSKRTVMQIDVNYSYFEFDLGYNASLLQQFWEDEQYARIVICICHELTHIVTEEANEMLKFKSTVKEREYYFERVTEHTSRWLYKYYEQLMDEKNIDIKTGLPRKK